jgi:hypothetical protein
VDTVTAYTERSFACHDVIGHIACGNIPAFGSDFWATPYRSVDIWSGRNPDFVHNICCLTEFTRLNVAIYLELYSLLFVTLLRASQLETQLDYLIQIAQDDSEEVLVRSAELMRLAAIIDLHSVCTTLCHSHRLLLTV